jgi:hypothetical protein
MIPALLVSFTLAELVGAGFQAAFGLADGESLTEAGVLGVLAGLAVTVLLVAPQAIGSVLGAKARRLGARRVGAWGLVANSVIGAYLVIATVIGLIGG